MSKMQMGDKVVLKDGRVATITGFRYPVRAWTEGGELRMKREREFPDVEIVLAGDVKEVVPFQMIVREGHGKLAATLVLVTVFIIGAGLLTLGLMWYALGKN